MKKFLYVLIFIFSVSLLFTGIAFAQEPLPSDDEVNAVASQLYCPVCESTPLDVCPTEACRQWRELIRTQLSEGMTEQQIKDYFVANYGARVLSEPPRTGLNWLVYILPPVIILLGAFFLFRSFREWTKASATAATVSAERSESEASSPAKDDYVARLEEELKKRK